MNVMYVYKSHFDRRFICEMIYARLYGVMLMQTIHYWSTYKRQVSASLTLMWMKLTSFPLRDPAWMKYYVRYRRVNLLAALYLRTQVGVLFLADTLNSAFNMAWIYDVLINNFGTCTL